MEPGWRGDLWKMRTYKILVCVMFDTPHEHSDEDATILIAGYFKSIHVNASSRDDAIFSVQSSIQDGVVSWERTEIVEIPCDDSALGIVWQSGRAMFPVEA
jgi:hypothetical protein